MGIYPQHVPLMTQILPGEVTVRKDGKDQFLAVGEGFVEITGDRVAILTDMAIKADDIDEAQAEEARRRAESRLQQKLSDGRQRRPRQGRMGRTGIAKRGRCGDPHLARRHAISRRARLTAGNCIAHHASRWLGLGVRAHWVRKIHHAGCARRTDEPHSRCPHHLARRSHRTSFHLAVLLDPSAPSRPRCTEFRRRPADRHPGQHEHQLRACHRFCVHLLHGHLQLQPRYK